jgi:hypothetical protein
MPITNNLKIQLDLPTWEWCRFAPANWDTNRPLTTAGDGRSRYLYGPNYIGATGYAYRYDTFTDAWQQMAQMIIAGTSTTSVQYTRHIGYFFRPTAATSTTVTGALLDGQHLQGVKIRIFEGTGDGQERTITSLASPVVSDRGYATAVNQNGTQVSWVRDTNKTWTVNQWVGYQMRIYNNAGVGMTRRILYNDTNTLYFYDPTWSSHSPFEWGAYITQTLSVASGTQTMYQIESVTATIDSPWDVTPDNTSQFMTNTGAMWMISGAGSAPFFTMSYYDVVADVWQMQPTQSGFVTSNLPESTLERMGEWGDPFATGIAASSTSTTITAAGAPDWPANRWANYRIRITGGTGVGQGRTIASSTSDSITVISPWSTTPDETSTFAIIADSDKLYMQYNGNPRLYQFSMRAQQWANSRISDYGVVRTISAMRGGGDNALEPFPVTSITRSGTTATVTTSLNHNLQTGDSVTIAGVTGADGSLYNGTFTITVTGITTFTYTMSGTPTASATFTAPTTTVLVDASKNWATNEHVGKTLQWSAATGYYQGVSGNAVITANTANTVTVATTSTTPVNGQAYTILDGPAFGFDNLTGNATTNGTGIATAGAATTLTDSTKNWKTNEHVGKILAITSGTGNNQNVVITSNTATVLSFGTITAPAANSRYSILWPSSRGTGLQLKWAGYPSDNSRGGRYMFSFRGGNTLQIERYDIATQQWENVSLQMFENLTTGSMYAYDGVDKIYIHHNATNKISVMDVNTYKVDLYSQAPYAQGTAVAGNRMEIVQTEDGLKFLYLTRHSATEMWRTLLFV